MRLVISRKGFDSSYGGVASPILPDGQMVSLPIPLKERLTFGDVRFYGADLGDAVASLTRGRLGPPDRVHLDPDLRSDARPRGDGWQPAFGQCDAAARHLDRQGIGVGDLFLFFGWFRQTQGQFPALTFVHGAPDLHVLFGWLQVGTVLRPGDRIPSWLQPHPHVSDPPPSPRPNNIYVASPALRIGDVDLGLPGGGVFSRYSPALQLTDPDAPSRRTWRVPVWFMGSPPLTYHANPLRWRVCDGHSLLETVGRGQEFVLDCSARPDSEKWLTELFQLERAEVLREGRRLEAEAGRSH